MTSVLAPPRRSNRSGALVRKIGPGFLGVCLALVAWIVLAAVLDLGEIFPQPWVVLQDAWHDRALLLNNTAPTLLVAAQGFVLGNLVVIPFALLAIAVPRSESFVIRVAVAIHVIPLIAIAPIIIISVSGNVANVVITAFVVYYPSLIAILLGFHAASPSALEMVKSVGGSRWSEIFKVRAHAALPNIFGGLLISLPVSLLGALVAEFFGGASGLGAVLVEAQRSLEVGRAWAIALYLAVIAVILYSLVSALRRLLVPWARGEQTTGGSLDDAAPATKASQVIASLAVAAVVLLVMWQVLVTAFGVSPAIAKRPLDILNYLTQEAAADGFWGEITGAIGETLLDSLVGFTAGMVGALILALFMSSFHLLERMFMPIIVVVRTLPLLALTPLIVLVFGRGLVTVAVVAGLISFFPTLVNLMTAFDNTPRSATDVVLAAGGSPMKAALKVRLFYAIPALTASMRVAVPQAIVGATLAEWLATGKGVGDLIITQYTLAGFDQLWSIAVLLVIVVMAVYLLIDVVDATVKRRIL